MPQRSTTTTRRQSGRQERPNVPALAEREAHPIVAELNQRMPAIARVLPRHMDPDRFASIVIRAVVDNPSLITIAASNPGSIIAAVMQAAQEGLEPTGSIGGAWLVPFGGKATLVRDYRGLARMAIRSGAAKRIDAHVVRRGDHFEYELGTDPHVTHRPQIGNNEAAIAYYAIAWLPDGSQKAEVMTPEQVEHIRSKSRAKDDGPWVTDFDQMARKTVIKRLMNYLPLSPEQRERLVAEETAEFGDLAPVVRVSAVPQHGDLRQRASQRAALLEGGNETSQQSEPPSEASGELDRSTNGAGASQRSTPAETEAPEGTPAADPEPELSLEEATMAAYSAASARGLTKGLADADAWKRIDEIAHEAIPDTDPDDLTVADWLAVRDRIGAGEFDQAVARPRS